MQVFLSFSSRDERLVAVFMEGLARQQIKYWDYLKPGERISPGEPILDRCKRMIEGSSHVFAFVTGATCDSVAGKYPQEEVRHALTVNKAKGVPIIIPVFDKCSPINALGEPYTELTGLLRLMVDANAPPTIEDAISRFCIEALDRIPKSLLPIDPRLNLIERLGCELESLSKIDRTGTVRMRLAAKAFSEMASAPVPQWNKCLRQIDAIIGVAEEYDLSHKLYFPIIMKGLCEVELMHLDEAEKTFTEAIENGPSSDIHGHAGLALVAQCRGQYGSAARILASLGTNGSWELHYNLAVALLSEGNEANIDIEAILSHVVLDKLQQDDQCRISVVLGSQHLRNDRLEMAESLFLRVLGPASGADREELYVAALRLSETYVILGHYDAAVELLDHWSDTLKEYELQYRSARILREIGDWMGSRSRFQALEFVGGEFQFKYLLGFARTLDLLGEKRELGRICNLILEKSRSRTLNKEERFYVGFAHFLIGDDRAANLIRETTNFSDNLFQHLHIRRVFG